MAFPVVQSNTRTVFATADTSHLANYPATVDAGDLLLILWIHRNTDGATTTTPTGYSLIGSSASAGNTSFYVFAKSAAGTEDGGTIDIVTTVAKRGVAHLYRITGWFNSGTPANDVEEAFANTSTSNPNPPALNPANWGTEDTEWIAAFGWDEDSNAITVSGYSYANGQVSDKTGAGFGHHGLASCYADSAVASEDPSAFTMSNTNNAVAATIAIRPAAAATLVAEEYDHLIGLRPSWPSPVVNVWL